jgi:cob(I)alamin adenosyltransferase
MNQIYTRRGDQGETSCADGSSVSKNNPIIECNGSIDECNCALGLARTHPIDPQLDAALKQIQNELFIAGAEISANGHPTHSLCITKTHIAALETLIDETEENLEPLTQFILPGGSPLAAQLHVCRSLARRAERRCTDIQADWINESALPAYLNRLSDALFVLARLACKQAGQADHAWIAPN